MQSYSTELVEANLDLRLVVHGHSPLHVPATILYDSKDPYAVRLELATGTEKGTIAWVFARSLLLEGTSKATGEGDVHVWPVLNGHSTALAFLSLSSPGGSALFEMDMTNLVEFLGRTLALVPEGRESEHVNLDEELASLLT